MYFWMHVRIFDVSGTCTYARTGSGAMTGIAADRVTFREPAPGAHGYHEGEVDAFLADVAQEMRRLAADNEALKERLREDLRTRLSEARAACGAAEQRLRELRAAVPDPGVVRLAERTADGLLAETRQECEEMLHKAGTEAARVVSDAELRASTIVADARHRHAELTAALPGRRAAALDRIAELRAEAEERRASITGQVSRRLQGLIAG